MTTVAVIGAGRMGVGTALALAHREYTVVLNDVSDEALRRAIEDIDRDSSVLMIATEDESYDNGPQSWAPELILSRITTETDIGKLSVADIVIENVTEDPAVKRSVHRQLDNVVSPDALVVINTSCIPITTIARNLKHAGNSVGIHFFNPVPYKDIAELIAGQDTTTAALRRAEDLLATLGITGIRAPDTPGFTANRMAMGLANEAALLVEEGRPAADVDSLLEAGLGHKMGILRTIDLIGVGTVVRSLWVLHDAYGERYRPCRLLRDMAETNTHFFPK